MGILTRGERIWNLRYGDADDDRTSPVGRGWRQLALSTLLDFNYLSASISGFFLIVIPALLVGIAPLLVVAFGQQNVEKLVLVRRYPLWSIGWVVGLGLVAALFGRSLLTRAIEDFWHLYYTLVFPCFVALRELVCAALERLPSGPLTAEALSRRRRLGTVIATVLLAGGGTLLSVTLPFSTDPRLVDARRPGPLALAALTNAVVVLALSTVAASLVWFWHEITSSEPVLNWKPGTITTPP